MVKRQTSKVKPEGGIRPKTTEHAKHTPRAKTCRSIPATSACIKEQTSKHIRLVPFLGATHRGCCESLQIGQAQGGVNGLGKGPNGRRSQSSPCTRKPRRALHAQPDMPERRWSSAAQGKSAPHCLAPTPFHCHLHCFLRSLGKGLLAGLRWRFPLRLCPALASSLHSPL